MCTICYSITSFSTVIVNKAGSAHFPMGYDINVYIIILYLYILYIKDNVKNNALYQNQSAPIHVCFQNGESLFLGKEKNEHALTWITICP